MKPSKKATAKIVAHAQKLDPTLTKNTSYLEAWVVMAEHYGLCGSILSNCPRNGDNTTFGLYKQSQDPDDNILIHMFEWSNAEVFEAGDWNWTIICKDVIEFVMKNRLYTDKNIKKFLKKQPEVKDKDEDSKILRSNAVSEGSKILRSNKPKSTKVHKSITEDKITVRSKKNNEKSHVSKSESIVPNKEELKMKKKQLYYKIRFGEKKGRDMTAERAEYDRIADLLKA